MRLRTTLIQARQALTQAGLAADPATRNGGLSDFQQGQVMQTDPPIGTVLGPNTPVVLVISQGA